MQKQDFYGLPRSIQDRFIESSQAVAAPAPLAALPVSQKSPLLWGGLTVVGAAGWAGFTSLGMGDLYSSLALSPLPAKIVHVAFAGAVAACALRAYSLSWAARRIPYGSGNYLFPCGVVVARGPSLVLHDARQLKSSQVQGASVRVEFQNGSTFVFPTGSNERAEQVGKAFDKAVENWKEVEGGEQLANARLNPLLESGVPNPLAPTQPHPKPILVPSAVSAGIILVLAVLH